MSKLYYTNIAITSSSSAKFAWEILSRMVANQAWTQAGSGDGTTFNNAAAGPVAGSGSGAGGLDNDGAWVRLAKIIGGVLYEIVFQRTAASPGSGEWAVSIGTAFTGGSPSATVRPTSAVEQSIYNSTIVEGSNIVLHVVLDNATPFGIVAFAYTSGTRANNGWFAMCPLTTVGTAPGAPYVFGAGTTYDISAMISAPGAWWHRRRYGLSGSAWVNAPMCDIRNGAARIYPFGAGNKAEATSETTSRAIPHSNAGDGDFGENAWLEWPSTDNGNANLYSVSSTGDRIQFDCVVLKFWDNTTPS